MIESIRLQPRPPFYLTSEQIDALRPETIEARTQVPAPKPPTHRQVASESEPRFR